MTESLHIFFDYACPYCYRAHQYLEELVPEFPGLDIAFHACEAHPRPDRYGSHSDLCARGMYYCMERGMDIWEYHEKIFQAIYHDGIDIENLDTLAEYLHSVVDKDQFRQALQSGQHMDTLSESNRHAWGALGLSAVPSYRMGSRQLNSVEDVGVTKEMLRDFIRQAF